MNIEECKAILEEPYENLFATIVAEQGENAQNISFVHMYFKTDSFDFMGEFDAEKYLTCTDPMDVLGACWVCNVRETLYRTAMRKGVGNTAANAWFTVYYEYMYLKLYERGCLLRDGKPRAKAYQWLH